MYWEDLIVRQAGDWAAEQRAIAPELPPTVEFAPRDEQVSRATMLLEELGIPGTVFPLSGAVRLPSGDLDRSTLWEAALDYVRHVDLPREPDERIELRANEYPPKHVGRQVLTTLLGLPSLGPGGRITEYNLSSRNFVDLTVRPVARAVAGGRWRDPRVVQAAVDGMVGGARGIQQLRAAYGYVEASAYETAGFARPSFVFVLDGPQFAEGPHWRVSIAVPATYGEEDGGNPGEDGLDSDWCV